MSEFEEVLRSHLSQAFRLGRASGFTMNLGQDDDWGQVAAVLAAQGECLWLERHVGRARFMAGFRLGRLVQRLIRGRR